MTEVPLNAENREVGAAKIGRVRAGPPLYRGELARCHLRQKSCREGGKILMNREPGDLPQIRKTLLDTKAF